MGSKETTGAPVGKPLKDALQEPPGVDIGAQSGRIGKGKGGGGGRDVRVRGEVEEIRERDSGRRGGKGDN